MTQNSKYFLKEGYVPNELIERSEDYWNPERIRASAYYQYPAYTYALRVMRERGLRSVIDVGCGVGTKLRLFRDRGLEIVGVDSPNAVEYCRSKYDFATFFAADLEKCDLSLGRTFDMILCSDVVEHLHDPSFLMRFLLSLAGEASYFVISTPDRDTMRGKHCFTAEGAHVREWNSEEFPLYLKSFGLRILEARHLLPVRMGWNRLFYDEVIRRFVDRKPVRTNQAYLCRLADTHPAAL